MSILSHWKECTWTNSEEFDRAPNEKVNPNKNLGMFPTTQAKPRARRGPIILMDSKELKNL